MTNLFMDVSQKELISLIEASETNTVDVLQTVDRILLVLPLEKQIAMLSKIFTGASAAFVQIHKISFADITRAGNPVLKVQLTIPDDQLNLMKTVEQRHEELLRGSVVIQDPMSIEAFNSYVENGQTQFAIPVPVDYLKLKTPEQKELFANRIIADRSLSSEGYNFSIRNGFSPKTKYCYQIISVFKSEEPVVSNVKETLVSKIKRFFYFLY